MPDVLVSELSSLSADLVKQARDELNEKLETRQSDIEIFRQLILGESDLLAPTDDAFLLRFLRARKFNFERSVRLFKRYYHFRTKYSDVYRDFRPSAISHVFQDGSKMMLLPQTDTLGRKALILRIGQWKPEDCSFNDLFRAFTMCLETAIMNETVQITGIIAVVDMEDIGFHQLRHLHPNNLKKQISLVQNSFPGRFKGFHLIRQPIMFNVIYALVKPFINEKLRGRIFFHGWDLESLHQHVPAQILPAEFGGSQPPLDNTEFTQSLLDLNDYFVQQSKFGYKCNKN